MRKVFNNKMVWIGLGLAVLLGLFLLATHDEQIDYSTQVKPILNKKCITCHGGVKAKAGFSLLFREEALAKTESGKPAIIPGNPGESEMIRRLSLKDPEERMPYQHEPLSGEEIDILTKWIKQGAQWGEHWAYVPLKPVEVPAVNSAFVKNSVDNFILAKLEEEKLQPSAEADKPTLLRRVSLDLIGMQPSPSLASQYLGNSNTNAYEMLVDSLLASPHFGERWASLWMDLARYADTKGYEADGGRVTWRYRDWLIKAFNEDKPYDKFLTEQLAGDLLPNPTDAQYIATAFHRNTMTNDEGGTDNEEFRTAAVLDRVNTTWEALMGTTFACVQCHSHPYDPFRHEEYYKFLAYFNNSRDEDTYEDYPLLRQYKSGDSLKLMQLTGWLAKNVSQQKADEVYTFLKTWQPTINSLQCDSFINGAQVSSWYAALRKNGSCRLPSVALDGKDYLVVRYTAEKSGLCKITLDSLNGQVLKTFPVNNTKYKWQFASFSIEPPPGIHHLYFSYINPAMKSMEETGVTFEWFYFTQKFPGQCKTGYETAYTQYQDLLDAKDISTTPIMVDNPADRQRETHVFERGNWLVKGDMVQPAVPAALNYAMPKKAPKNRLGLAMWLTSKQNPLVARTMVNRLWEQLFGAGIAETLEDLGTQGISPTHLELLNYLSFQFMNGYQWSIKRLLKEMVMSATYRQDSKVTEELKEKDLFNKLYARGPRVRLSAEQVRDQALCFSSSINKDMYGPSVFPFQPKGLWLSPYNGADWEMNKNGQQYRRAVYTYWKRTAPYPSMLTFDGASREVCTARRVRTNTPLQALVTLNDSAYVDMSRLFAYHLQKEGGKSVQQQIAKGYELMLYKPIAPAKLQSLLKLYNEALVKFRKNKEQVCAINGGMNEYATPETAALIVVANAMLNLDEVVTKG
ncbi:DUF1553 domain-containing protein [Foetidibacter luteolus]|uniref:DUF1553 domain-containing protein n=1 Tax=Foetidibacter luteolus TaxID=2608880 RepID=UPI001F276375|nr:DUF1553 domain-containing protein [Foetidibacter luteolus]